MREAAIVTSGAATVLLILAQVRERTALPVVPPPPAFPGGDRGCSSSFTALTRQTGAAGSTARSRLAVAIARRTAAFLPCNAVAKGPKTTKMHARRSYTASV